MMRKFKTINGNLIVKGGKKKIAIQTYAKNLVF